MRINLLLLLILVFPFIDASAQQNNDLERNIKGCYVYRNPCFRVERIEYKFFKDNYFTKKQKSVLTRYLYLGKWRINNDTIYLTSIPKDSIELLPKKYNNILANAIVSDSIGFFHKKNCLFSLKLYKKRTFFRSLISWIYFIYPQWEMKKDCKKLEKIFNIKIQNCECGSF